MPIDDQDIQASSHGARGPGTILCVDDDPGNRYVRGRILRSHGFAVLDAGSGADALRLASEEQPALVLLDIQMPDMNGFAVCRQLKANPRTARIPVLHIFSLGKREHEYPEALENGAEAYLQEPVEPSVLTSVIDALIRAASADARARKSERDAVDILESAGEAMYLLDEDYRFTYVNAEAERLTGIRREGLIGKTHWEVFPESVGTAVDREYRRVMAERVACSFDHFYQPWQKWFEIHASPVGQKGMVVHFRDITGRKQAEEERQRLVRDLTERTGELHAILDSVPVAIWIAHDPQCARITGNAYADRQVMRVPRGDNISRSASPDAAVSYRVFRDGVELRAEELPAQAAARIGKPVLDEELDLLFPDGRTVSLLMGAVPLFDAEGRVRGSVAAGADVTPLRRAEQEMRMQRAALEVTARFPGQNPSPVLRVGGNGELLYANPASSEVTAAWQCEVGQPVPAFLGQAVEAALARGTPAELETRVGARDYSFVIAPMAEGGYANLYGRDVTERIRLTDRLRERIEELETVMEVAPAAIWVAHDRECRQITGNRMADQFYEAGAGENVSANASAARRFFQDGRELEPQELPMQQAVAGGLEIRDRELDVLLPSGSRMRMLGHARPLKDAAGQVRGCVGAFLDITARKRAEEALRESEIRYRTLFNSIDEGYCIVEMIFDGNGKAIDYRFLEVNQSFERQTGLKGAKGKRIRELVPGHEEYWFEIYGRIALTGQPARFENRAEQLHRTYDVYAYRFGAPEGRQVAVLFNDITERNRAETRLRASEERYRTLFSSMNEGFAVGEAICDGSGDPIDFRFLEMNDAFERQCGLGRQILGRPMREVLPRLEQVWIDTYCRVALTGEAVRFDEYNRDTARHYSVFCYSPGRGSFAILFRDITDLKRTETALRESERQFRIMGETVPYGVWLCGPDGGVRYCSQSFLDLLQMTQEEQQQFGWTRRLPPEDVEPMMKKWLHCCATGNPWEHEHRIFDENGAMVTILSKGLPVRNAEGSITCWVGVNLDITHRKGAERALRESEERFRRLVEVSAQTVWVTDAQGEATADSPSWRAFTGRSIEQSRGWNWLDAIHPDDRARVADAWTHALRTATLYQMEYRQLHASGEYREVASHAAPIFNPDGTVREWVGMSSDITARKRAEQALANAMQRLNAHMDNSPLAVIEFDPQFRVTRWSREAERIFGWSPAEVLGRGIAEIRWVHEDDAEAVRRVTREMVSGRLPRNVIVNRNYRKDGSVVECEWYNSAIYDGERKLASTLSQVLDVTDRKRTEERLREAQKTESIAVLAGGVAHDFNNLLVGVIGNASLATEMLPAGSPIEQLLERIIKSGEQAAHLTKQMLAYSGGGRFVMEPMDLSEVVREVTDLIRSTASKKIGIQLDLEPGLPFIEADRSQMHQVLMNLVINATEAIGSEPGLIAVETGVRSIDDEFIGEAQVANITPGRFVFLEVRDTGCGMSEATKERIFDPFFTTKVLGRGLGLAAVAGIVRGHKGAIRVQTAPGRGTSFLLLLPAMKSDPGVRVSARQKPPELHLRANGAILVVDDEEAVRNVARLSLERRGCRVLVAGSGSEALDLLREHAEAISVVILDLSMPGMSGQEVLPKMLAINPRTDVIVSSGYGESDALRLFEGMPVAAFIQKPYTIQTLVEKVKAILDNRRD